MTSGRNSSTSAPCFTVLISGSSLAEGQYVLVECLSSLTCSHLDRAPVALAGGEGHRHTVRRRELAHQLSDGRPEVSIVAGAAGLDDNLGGALHASSGPADGERSGDFDDR